MIAIRAVPLLAAALVLAASPGVGAADPDRFEKDVAAYEAADRLQPPPTGAILLAGDSQFFRWKTVGEDLRGYTVVNRGIDSFQTSDLVRYADRLVLPHRPRLIVLHVGGNDVHNGKTPPEVLADFKAFVAKVRTILPDVPIAFSSITPGPGRWDEADRRKATNRVIEDYVGAQPNLAFIDLWDAMLTPEGQPREDLWVADRVHPNHAGYLLRVQIMRPLLGPPDRPDAVGDGTPSEADRAAIEKTSLEVRAGFARGDVETVLAYHHPDVIKQLAWDRSLVGRDAVAADLRAGLQANRLEFVDDKMENLRVYGDTAVQQSVFAIRVTPRAGGSASIFRGRALLVLRRYEKSPTGWATIQEMIQPAP